MPNTESHAYRHRVTKERRGEKTKEIRRRRERLGTGAVARARVYSLVLPRERESE